LTQGAQKIFGGRTLAVKVKIVAIIQTKKSSNAHKGLSEKNRRQPPYHQKIIDNCTSPCTVGSLFGKMQTQSRYKVQLKVETEQLNWCVVAGKRPEPLVHRPEFGKKSVGVGP
jgi:hypothetical protein